MAITLDVATQPAQSIGVTSQTTSVTLAGGNSILIVGINSGNASDATVTWNGVSMVLAGIAQKDNSVGDDWGKLFYLINPDLGTHNLVVSCSTSTIDTSIANFNGMKQQAPTQTGGTSLGTGTSSTDALTPTDDNSMHIALFGTQGTNTVGGGTQIVVTNGSAGLYASSPYAITPAAANTLTVTHGSAPWYACGAVFSPAAGGAAALSYRTLLGVGI